MNENRQTFAAFKRNTYFKALDGLRAVAILMVLFHHAPKYPPGHALQVLQENGRYGVAFFFVISGFLICTLLLRESGRNGRIDLARFYGRRAARLLPLYYATLLVQALLIFGLNAYSPANRVLFIQKLPSYLFFYSNWLPTAWLGPFFQAWSLAAEEQFYLLFGLFLVIAPRAIVPAAFLGLVMKFGVFQMLGVFNPHSPVCRAVFSYQEPILYGVLAAYALHDPRCHRSVARFLQSRWVSLSLAVSIAVLLCWDPIGVENLWDAQVIYILMTFLLISLVLKPSSAPLENPQLVRIGKISYGIYLLHMFIVSILAKTPAANSPLLFFILSAAISTLAASFVYDHFERPVIARFKREFSPRPAKPSNDAPAVLGLEPGL